MPGPFAVWKLQVAIPAVCDEHDATLPKEAVLKIIATSVASDLVEVEWQNKHFFVSRADLANNGERVRGKRGSKTT